MTLSAAVGPHTQNIWPWTAFDTKSKRLKSETSRVTSREVHLERVTQDTRVCADQPRDGRRGIGPGRAEEGRRSATIDSMWEMGKIWGEREEKKRRQYSIGSVGADPGYQANITRYRGKRKALPQGLSTSC